MQKNNRGKVRTRNPFSLNLNHAYIDLLWSKSQVDKALKRVDDYFSCILRNVKLNWEQKLREYKNCYLTSRVKDFEKKNTEKIELKKVYPTKFTDLGESYY